MLQARDQIPILIAECVERLVSSRTGGKIRNLRVEINEDKIVLSGRTTTYYNKQLATHAALTAIENASLANEIEVC